VLKNEEQDHQSTQMMQTDVNETPIEIKNSIPTNVTVLIKEESEKTDRPIITIK
jgi:hypothetical protein